MKIEKDKITCTNCGNKRVKLIMHGYDIAKLQCTKCKREVKCSAMKIGDLFFDIKSMEGKDLV
jgi:DNA-directed RNA polymerase subunit RPC12/RpoP